MENEKEAVMIQGFKGFRARYGSITSNIPEAVNGQRPYTPEARNQTQASTWVCVCVFSFFPSCERSG